MHEPVRLKVELLPNEAQALRCWAGLYHLPTEDALRLAVRLVLEQAARHHPVVAEVLDGC
jgi:hypothetical protein